MKDGTTTTLEGLNVVLATGSKPRTLPGVEIDGEVVQTSDQALWFTEAPHRAVTIGAGAIGMEFASMWAPMGTDVTVVEALDRVLPLEDPHCSKGIERAYRKRGIEVLTLATVKKVETGNGSASVVVDFRHNEMEFEADVVLVAIGRGPNTVDTGAEELGILDDRGYVQTDEYGRTAVKGIWAVGDVRPTLALAHAAFAEGFVVGDLLAKVDNVQPVDHIQTPRVTYCHPEVASVGLTEPDARERYGNDGITTTTYSLTANAKTLIAGSEGFVKVIARPGEFGETVGVHIVGPHSTDLIGEAAVVTDWGALPSEVGAITHAHPTVHEAMGEAFLAASGTPFHGH